MASYLVVIYGTSPRAPDVARELTRAMPGHSAVLSTTHLADEAIGQPGPDATAELDMVHTQMRLLVANYMRNGYNVVVEGPFYHRRNGELLRYEQDIDQLVALMRQMTRKALTVHLRSGTDAESFEYKARYGRTAMALDAATSSTEAVVDAIVGRLLAEDSS